MTHAARPGSPRSNPAFAGVMRGKLTQGFIHPREVFSRKCPAGYRREGDTKTMSPAPAPAE